MQPSLLRVTPGTGLLARRSTELLFVPSGVSELATVFDSALPGEALEQVTLVAEERGFEIGEFVVVDWTDGVRIAVFGAIDVVSDHRSLPRLSGGGSGTWVERSMRSADGPVTIAVEGDEANQATDLRSGLVQAGGFQLTVTPGQPAEHDRPPRRERTVAVAADRDIDTVGAPRAALVDPVRVDQPAANVVDAEPSRDAVMDAAAAALADVVLGHAVMPSTAVDAFVAAPDDPTIVPDPVMRAAIADLVGTAEPEVASPTGGRTVKARRCTTCRASNPLLAVECRACGAPLMPGDDNVEDVSAPSWRLVFMDGGEEPIDATLILGRKPSLRDGDAADTTRLVRLECSQVSSRHLEVRPVDWDVVITDLGSSNGTFLLTTGDGQLVRLEPGQPHRVDLGMLMQVGTKRFRIDQAPRQ